MKVVYDRETDTLTLILSDGRIVESDELRDGVIVDYNEQGRVVSVEILDASKSTTDPAAISYELKEKTA
jgi:YD repeat-containing protein